MARAGPRQLTIAPAPETPLILFKIVYSQLSMPGSVLRAGTTVKALPTSSLPLLLPSPSSIVLHSVASILFLGTGNHLCLQWHLCADLGKRHRVTEILHLLVHPQMATMARMGQGQSQKTRNSPGSQGLKYLDHPPLFSKGIRKGQE